MWFTAVALAAPAMPKLVLPPPSWQLDAGSICYGSGLSLTVVRRPEAGVVAISTVVGGGSSAEDASDRGAAHLVEHLWFRSHPDGGPRPWDLPTLQLDGTTLNDATVYTTVGAPEDLPQLLALEAARLTDPLQGLDDRAVADEKRVVASELAWRGEESDRRAWRYLDTLLWPADHPYATSVASIEQSDALTLDAARTYVAASYRPERTSIRIEGDLDPNTLPDLMRRAFPSALLDGSVQSCDHPASTAEPPDPARSTWVAIEAPVERPRMMVAWSLPAKDEVMGRFAADRIEEIVWRPLYKTGNWWSQHRDVEAGCVYVPGLLAAEVVCSVELPDATMLDQAWGSMRRGAEQPWETSSSSFGFTTGLIESAAAFYEGAFADLDRLDDAALQGRGLSSYVGVVDPTAPVIDRVRGMDETEVGRFMVRWFDKSRMVGVGLVPKAPTGAAAVAVGEPPPERPVPSGWHVPSARDEVTTRGLANGLSIWTADRPDAPVLARTILVSRGGWATSPLAGENEVLEALERYDLPVSLFDLHQEVALDQSILYGSMADELWTVSEVGNLDLALWVQEGLETHFVMNLAGRQENLDRAVADAFAEFRTDPAATSRSLRTQWLLPGDRAGQPWWEGVRAARSVGQGDVLAWQKRVRQPSTSVLVEVGPLGDASPGLADTYLGAWKARGKAASEAELPPLPPAPAPKTWVLDDRSVMSDVRLTCRVPGRTDANAAAHAVLVSALRRSLFHALREARGTYAWDVAEEFVDPRVGLLTLDAVVPPPDVPGTVDALTSAVRTAGVGLPDELLSFARLDAGAAHARSLATADATSATLRTLAAERRTPEGLAKLDDAIAATTSAEVAALLADCAGHEAITAIGPDVPQLEGERVDWAKLGAELADSLR